jgi:hypothetical protein
VEPDRTLVAVSFLVLTAVSLAAAEPVPVGAKRTVTLHDLAGPRLVPVHPSSDTLNAEEPDTVMVRAPVPDRPGLDSVMVFESVWPTMTEP